MDLRQLVETYFDQIEIEDANFIPVDDAVSDAAYLLLNIPTEMLNAYSKLKDQNRELPDGAEFWKETGLQNKLRTSDKYHGQGHVSNLSDVLDYLGGKVWGEYRKLNSPERIRLGITEVPEFYSD